jgi:hypothetical protein
MNDRPWIEIDISELGFVPNVEIEILVCDAPMKLANPDLCEEMEAEELSDASDG